MKHFNLMYHGSAEDVAAQLETGVELMPPELGALLCNIMRKIAKLEEPKPASQIWRVTVEKAVAFGNVHDLDKDVEGDYPFIATSEEDALDQFHNTVPIKVLDDFEISAETFQ